MQFLLAVICLLSIFTYVTCLMAMKSIMHNDELSLFSGTRASATRLSYSYTPEEIEKIKEYAIMFGVDASMSTVNTEEMLEYGRKLEEQFGTDMVDMVIRASKKFVNQLSHVKTSVTSSHKVTHIISIAKLIVTQDEMINMFRVRGGDRNGEEASSSYSAA